MISDPSTSIWDMAKWRKGRHSPWLPPIDRSSNPHQMGKSFEKHFFHFPHPPNTILNLPGTPAPERPYYPITKNEVDHALTKTSNKSTLGPSGIGYKLVKWAFGSHPKLILDIYNATLCLGYHPWTTAKVVIIPKPNKLDYSAAIFFFFFFNWIL